MRLCVYILYHHIKYSSQYIDNNTYYMICSILLSIIDETCLSNFICNIICITNSETHMISYRNSNIVIKCMGPTMVFNRLALPSRFVAGNDFLHGGHWAMIQGLWRLAIQQDG